MKIEVKKIKHARSLSEETNAFTGALYVNDEHIADCKNSGHGGSTDIYPKYSEDEKKRKHYREMIEKADAFCKTLPNVESDFSAEGLKMSLEFFIDLEVEKDLRNKDVQSVLKKLDKESLKSVVIISKKKFDDFVSGKTLELPQKLYGWNRPINQIPVEVLKKQLPSIKTKMVDDEFIYNKNLPND